jgi:tRNA 2-selenouridine synthase
MLTLLEPDDFLEAAARFSVLDVRTPSEFAKGHIPGAFNLPLFSDEERAVVGTLYTKKGRSEAVLKGLDLIGPKLASFVEQAKELGGQKRVLVHCWRGGMRSSSMAWLLNTAGIKASVLRGGYKAYRERFRNLLQTEPWQFFVVGGPTGSGKTDVLHSLSNLGEQVLDLEGLAHHKGSAFGALGQDQQPTTEQFENDLHAIFCTFTPDRPVWVEGESSSIGHVFVPEGLFALMQSAPLIMFELSREQRVKRLVKEYGCFDTGLLRESVLKIKKRMGGLLTQEALEALEHGDYKRVAEITLVYYDKGYAHSLARRNLPAFSLETSIDDPGDSARQLKQWADSFVQPK